jgi:hypothetical protein
MASEDKNDRQLSEEKARFIFFLARWRDQLLIDETEDNSDAIELDRRVLDYYLDQYNELATFRFAVSLQEEPVSLRSVLRESRGLLREGGHPEE